VRFASVMAAADVSKTISFKGAHDAFCSFVMLHDSESPSLLTILEALHDMNMSTGYHPAIVTAELGNFKALYEI
jgi:hypothetical protein